MVEVALSLSSDQIETYRADDRGRINLGTDFAHEDVEVAVLEIVEEDE